MKRVYHSVVKPYVSWRTAFNVAAISLLVWLYLFNIGSLVPGMSPAEIEHIGESSTKNELISNPLYAPHKIIVYGLTKMKVYSPEAFRTISALFTVCVVVAFYQLLKKWHSTKIAILATAMFASSSWLLATGRHATPTALLLVWFVLLVGLFWLRHYATRKFTMYILAVIFAAAIYIPTAPYIFAIFGALYGLRIIKFMKRLGRLHVAGIALLLMILVAPLIYAFVNSPSLIKEWFLIPDEISPRLIFDNFVSLPRALIYSAPHNPEFWLSRLPLLDLFSGTMLLLGIYSYRYHLRLKRTPLIWTCIIAGTLLVALSGLKAAIILLPFLYILIANGLSFFLGEWFTVFPKNPLARTLGTSLVVAGVLLASFYQLNRYFVGWPKAPATNQLYSIKQ